MYTIFSEGNKSLIVAKVSVSTFIFLVSFEKFLKSKSLMWTWNKVALFSSIQEYSLHRFLNYTPTRRLKLKKHGASISNEKPEMYNVACSLQLRVTTIFTRIRNNEIINRIETDEEENARRKDFRLLNRRVSRGGTKETIKISFSLGRDTSSSRNDDDQRKSPVIRSASRH